MENNEILYNSKYLQLKNAKTKNGDNWVYAHRPNVDDVVVILPVIENKKILFLIEERPPIQNENIGKYTIGVPAGLVGDERKGESLEDAIKSELLEEAGLIADKIFIKSRKIASSAGCLSETFAVAIAYIDEYKLASEPVDDNGVIKERILVDINDLYNWLKEKESEGYVLTAQALSALFYLNEGD